MGAYICRACGQLFNHKKQGRPSHCLSEECQEQKRKDLYQRRKHWAQATRNNPPKATGPARKCQRELWGDKPCGRPVTPPNRFLCNQCLWDLPGEGKGSM